MVKQDFKNKPVIAMLAAGSSAKLLCQTRYSVERDVASLQAHLAPEMKTFDELLWLMKHITEA